MSDFRASVSASGHNNHLVILPQVVDHLSHLIWRTYSTAMKDKKRLALAINLIVNFCIAGLRIMPCRCVVAVGRIAALGFRCLHKIAYTALGFSRLADFHASRQQNRRTQQKCASPIEHFLPNHTYASKSQTSIPAAASYLSPILPPCTGTRTSSAV